ncbi:2OG-Fe(II) oxygenase [Novosphingobium sp.]|uniref:prolyl hydroxylase family protein n=1 Tax=Novosphingobium sp. TaxID=1874826 RepID=UPI0025DD1586|nr:2OG-Fe(II) oxygenase [Novosphingobium sp.]
MDSAAKILPAPDKAYHDPAKLAWLGAQVRQRLGSIPGVERIDTSHADMFLAPGFLDKRDCRDLARLIDAGAQPSTLFKGTERPDFRTSWTCHLPSTEPLVESLEEYISDLLGIHNAYAETAQGQRYRPGEQYKAHHDFFHAGHDYWLREAPRGGQRTWTAMVYLNEPKEGGETEFPLLDVAIRPRTGTLVVWNNMALDGTPNMKTLHAAKPVIGGVKHVITKWYRLGPWRLLNT